MRARYDEGRAAPYGEVPFVDEAGDEQDEEPPAEVPAEQQPATPDRPVYPAQRPASAERGGGRDPVANDWGAFMLQLRHDVDAGRFGERIPDENRLRAMLERGAAPPNADNIPFLHPAGHAQPQRALVVRRGRERARRRVGGIPGGVQLDARGEPVIQFPPVPLQLDFRGGDRPLVPVPGPGEEEKMNVPDLPDQGG